ncbi:MAG: hypothetical protein Q7J22_00765 [Candidatus Wolfebacteria bacterium]|nr:hypothetical protein [Candidatus Wolfebacteria bacterium]MDP2703872.1 hypothetical protein [bacterium]
MKNPIPEHVRTPIGIIGIIAISGAMGVVSGLPPISHTRELFNAVIAGLIPGIIVGRSMTKVSSPMLAIGSVILTLLLIVPYEIGFTWGNSRFTAEQTTLLIVIAMATAASVSLIIRSQREKTK